MEVSTEFISPLEPMYRCLDVRSTQHEGIYFGCHEINPVDTDNSLSDVFRP